jgi:hypothetical protein
MYAEKQIKIARMTIRNILVLELGRRFGGSEPLGSELTAGIDALIIDGMQIVDKDLSSVIDLIRVLPIFVLPRWRKIF